MKPMDIYILTYSTATKHSTVVGAYSTRQLAEYEMHRLAIATPNATVCIEEMLADEPLDDSKLEGA
jgi:hypothetical protein